MIKTRLSKFFITKQLQIVLNTILSTCYSGLAMHIKWYLGDAEVPFLLDKSHNIFHLKSSFKHSTSPIEMDNIFLVLVLVFCQ